MTSVAMLLKNVRALTAHHRGCAQKKQRDIETAAHKQTKKNRRPRCPKGMRRNRKTGICEPM